MGLHIDKPLPGEDDNVVVYMARDAEKAKRARDGLGEVGISLPLEMPDAALDAMFESQREVAIRVPAQDFAKAMDVIDALFPEDMEAPAIELPPLPEDEPAAEAVELDDSALKEARGKANKRKLESSAGKVIAIAGISVVVPALGALTGLFSLYSAFWCLGRAKELGVPKAASRAQLALWISLVALAAQGVWVWLYVNSQAA